jgi:S-adenosylmethionine uptake transporter
VVGAGTTVTFFFGLVRLPLVEAISISFIAPLITLFLAAILLGEKIGTRAIGASLLGLGGVVVIAFAGSRPETSHPEAGLGIAAVLLSAVLYAWNLVLQRQQALLARPREVGVFQTAVATVTLGLASPWLLVVPQGDDWAYVGTSAVLALAALMLASWAYGRAEAQALVPFEYSAFLWAALIGWVAFSEAVTLPTIIGAVLIIAGCWIATPKRHIEQTAL